jgi:hypothetical protein
LKKKTLKPDDIFILSASGKQATFRKNDEAADNPVARVKQTPLQVLNDHLAENKISVRTNFSDDMQGGDDNDAGSIVCTTFHSSKGRERRLVYVIGFSAGYFKYNARDADPMLCPNPLYVACTRAKERLVLCAEDTEGDCLPFLSSKLLPVWKRAVKIIVKGEMRPRKEEEREKPSQDQIVPVTSLLQHLPESAISSALSKVEFKCSREVPKRGTPFAVMNGDIGIIKMVDSVPSSVDEDLMESVADLNGTSLSCFLEVIILKKSKPTMMGQIEKKISEFGNSNRQMLQRQSLKTLIII